MSKLWSLFKKLDGWTDMELSAGLFAGAIVGLIFSLIVTPRISREFGLGSATAISVAFLTLICFFTGLLKNQDRLVTGLVAGTASGVSATSVCLTAVGVYLLISNVGPLIFLGSLTILAAAFFLRKLPNWLWTRKTRKFIKTADVIFHPVLEALLDYMNTAQCVGSTALLPKAEALFNKLPKMAREYESLKRAVDTADQITRELYQRGLEESQRELQEITCIFSEEHLRLSRELAAQKEPQAEQRKTLSLPTLESLGDTLDSLRGIQEGLRETEEITQLGADALDREFSELETGVARALPFRKQSPGS